MVRHGTAPDHGCQVAAAMLAQAAPSVDGLQPWEWRLGETIDLVEVREGMERTDGRARRDTDAGLGLTLHHMSVALRAMGWRCAVRLFPEPDRPDLVARLQPRSHHVTADDSALAAAISRRRTDHRRYSAWPLHWSVLDSFVRRAADLDVVARALEPTPDTPVHGGEVIVLCTEDDGRRAALRAGQAASAVLLAATATGLASALVADVDEIEHSPLADPDRLVLEVTYPQVALRVGWLHLGEAPLPPDDGR
ncbi:MAG: hypothetical protein INR72_09985 [Williamsia herbipolensis]|nr:hypothetical protein [Williamsia herbipolensis]